MNLRILLVLVPCALFLVPAHAQERAAAQPFNSAGDVTNTALLQKISYLQQRVNMQEEQLRKCGAATGSANDNATTAADTTSAHQPDADDTPATATSSYTTYRGPSAIPAAAPTRRLSGGYQTEARLGCEDYSRSYFSRHLAMAAVCKAYIADDETSATTVTPTLPPIVTSATTVVSTTTRTRTVSATTR